MIQKYKHISFDLDGTLVHTVQNYRQKVVTEVVTKLGGEKPDDGAIDIFWFENNRGRIIRDLFKLDPKKFWELFREADIANVRNEHTFAYVYAERAFLKLKKLGKVVSIVTGSPQWIADMEIAKLNNAPHDYHLSISSEGHAEKPNPSSLLFVLDKLGSSPEETLYIGNSNEDAYFARNAGCDFLYLERREHEFDNKDWVIGTIHSLDELF